MSSDDTGGAGVRLTLPLLHGLSAKHRTPTTWPSLPAAHGCFVKLLYLQSRAGPSASPLGPCYDCGWNRGLGRRSARSPMGDPYKSSQSRAREIARNEVTNSIAAMFPCVPG